MKIAKYIAALVALFTIVAAFPVIADEGKQKLFVNLTSDDIDRAAMAIGFSTNILAEKKIPVTIFLNVQGVRLADKNIPQNKYANGKTMHEML